MILKIYAWAILGALVSFILFYVSEYAARGGKMSDALIGAIRLLVLLCPLVLAVFYYATPSVGIHPIAWRLYAIFLLGFLVWKALSEMGRRSLIALSQKIIQWPLVGTAVFCVLLLLFLPALIILVKLCS